jgi:hypothetical protein
MSTEPSRQPATLTIWIDVLCVSSLLKTAPILFRDPEARAYFFNTSRAFAPMAKWACRWFGGRLARVADIDFVETRLNDLSLWEWLVLELYGLWDSMREDPRLKRTRSAFCDTYKVDLKRLDPHLFERVSLLSLRPIEMVGVSKCRGTGQNLLIVRKTIAVPFLAARYSDVRFKAYGGGLLPQRFVPRPRFDFDRQIVAEYSRSALTMTVSLCIRMASLATTSVLVGLAKAVTGNRWNKISSLKKPVLAVYYTQPHYRPDSVSDLSWWPESQIDAKHIVVFFKFDIAPEWRAKMAADGLTLARWITNPVTFFRQALRPTDDSYGYHFLCPRPGGVFRAIGRAIGYLLTASGSDTPFWLRVKLAEFVYRTTWHVALYRELGVKIIWNIEDVETDKAVSAEAIRRCGGLKMSSHGSYFAMLDSFVDHVDDVLFTWGEELAQVVFKRFPQDAKYVVGFPWDRHLKHDTEITERLRRETAGKFRIALMDSNSPMDTPVSPYANREAWRALLELLKQNDDVVVFWKPKHIARALKRLSDFPPDVEKFLDAGRIVLVTGNDSNQRARPAEVARASDLVVGLGIHTAAMESHMAGTPAFHFDPARTQDSKFGQRGANLIVFHDADSLQAAIQQMMATRILRDADKIETLYRQIDPFQDGRAYLRTGRIIRSYLNELAQGAPLGQIHDKARAHMSAGMERAEEIIQ